MKTVTILSGKGGVGKSSISASLAVTMSKNRNVICADCDVDASNLALVLGVEKYEEWKPLSTNQKVEFDLKKCNSCKKCFDACHFKAIDWVNNKPKLKKFSCEGCDVCTLVCPKNATQMVDIDNAQLGYAKTNYGFTVVSAQLGVGQSGSGKVVTEVKKKAISLQKDADLLLIDSSAGTGCPVIASVTGSDYVIIVTEPTPSGISDMKKAIDMVNHFKIPYGIIINKFDINMESVEDIENLSKKQNAKILVRLPYDRKFSEALVNLTPIVSYDDKFKSAFEDISSQMINILEPATP